MSVLEKLQRRVRILDRRVTQSLTHSYDENAAEQRELLEEAIQELATLQTTVDLYRSLDQPTQQMGG